MYTICSMFVECGLGLPWCRQGSCTIPYPYSSGSSSDNECVAMAGHGGVRPRTQHATQLFCSKRCRMRHSPQPPRMQNLSRPAARKAGSAPAQRAAHSTAPHCPDICMHGIRQPVGYYGYPCVCTAIRAHTISNRFTSTAQAAQAGRDSRL